MTGLLNTAGQREKLDRLTEGIFERARSSGVGYDMEVNPLPVSNRRLRLAPSPRVATLVAVFLLVGALLVVGWQVLKAPGAPPPEGVINPQASLGSSLKDTGKDASPTPGPSSAPALFMPGANGSEVVVYVSGQVEHPGLFHLSDPARVADALEAAGGAKEGADISALNLARLLVDGEQIHVPLPGEAVPPSATGPDSTGSGPNSPAGGLVNLNTADLSTLEGLSGIGPALAQRIIDYRKSNGRFSSVDQLDEVPGIGPSLLQRLRDQVTV